MNKFTDKIRSAVSAPSNEPETVTVGEVYRSRDVNTDEVIPFFVDQMSGEVLFAPVGMSHEHRLMGDEFLRRFEATGSTLSARAEKQKTPATPEVDVA